MTKANSTQAPAGASGPRVTHYRWVQRLGVNMIVASVDEAIAEGIVVDDGKTSRKRLQIGTLLNALGEGGFTAALWGGRRDEEKARSKEGVYSQGLGKVAFQQVKSSWTGRCGLLA